MFTDKNSLYNTRWECWNLVKKEDEVFVTYAGTVNRMCERFKLKELTRDMFKCLIFVQELAANKDAEIRARILTKIGQADQSLTLQTVAKECQRLVNLRTERNKKLKRKISHKYRHVNWEGINKRKCQDKTHATDVETYISRRIVLSKRKKRYSCQNNRTQELTLQSKVRKFELKNSKVFSTESRNDTKKRKFVHVKANKRSVC
ncbi:uncharacterized protein LOC106873898 [Octopus bimaculoides]|uniref:uncharacterized protein LOC106873898 n=1 Tax=Octopus bimaculoides TaxID=37653 RepID=UPI00071D400B|nr:uncharacterized protein LOC106873898 [Octopus bimaculoides]|eukprot:XP_014776911.1 PREDICTED: uncharacterized protein LOC106873898 [Octopus bimaculoides]